MSYTKTFSFRPGVEFPLSVVAGVATIAGTVSFSIPAPIETNYAGIRIKNITICTNVPSQVVPVDYDAENGITVQIGSTVLLHEIKMAGLNVMQSVDLPVKAKTGESYVDITISCETNGRTIDSSINGNYSACVILTCEV